ncbi:MAG: YceH family protein, partial [Solirubrobacteraceae bacterium]|nr:YceH family protein [Solirubrobacteraceae bacterium]
MDLDPVEQRVLGCLIEKRRTTPDGYPLSLNALRLACNQSTNRDPVMQLGDDEVREAATGLHGHGLVRIAAAGQGSRTTKYRHTAEEGLPATDDELAVISVLLVRGPQTRGEIRTRSERLYAFSSLDELSATLDGLGMRGLIELLDREPGAREARYTHRLGHRDDPEAAAAVAQAAEEHRARLRAEGRLPADGDDVGEGDDEGPSEEPALRVPAAPATPAPQPSTRSFVAADDGYEYAIGDEDEPAAPPATPAAPAGHAPVAHASTPPAAAPAPAAAP